MSGTVDPIEVVVVTTPGPQGPQGIQGPQGPPGVSFSEAPADGQTYGRVGSSKSWVPALPLTGGTMTGALTLSGISTAPTASPGVNTTQIASTAFVTAAVGAATTGGPFLPLTGGTMTGALNTTATGGSVTRSAQDRWADYVNVKDFGATGAQSNDDTAAINAALSYARTFSQPKAVYLPAGSYRITDALNVTNQVLFGDGRGQSILWIPTTGFNASALGFVNLTGSNACGMRDIGFQFNQPDTTVRANLVVFPPAIYLTAGARAQIVRVRVNGGASYGIDCRRNSAPFIEQFECCALVKGLMIDGPADVVHLNEFHFWPFGLSTTLSNSIFYDQTTVAAELGRIDGLDCHGFFSTGGQLHITAGTAGYGYYSFSNLFMDTNATTLVEGGQLLFISNMMGSADNTLAGPWISVTSGTQVKVMGLQCIAQGGPVISVNNTAADVVVNGGELRQYNLGANAAVVSNGRLGVINMKLTAAGAITVPFVSQTGGSLVATNNYFSSASTGVGISVASDNAGNLVANNAMQSMTVTTPTYSGGFLLGTYGPPSGPLQVPNGLSFGNQNAASVTDLTKHIRLQGNNYGINTTANQVNYNSNGLHNFMLAGTTIGTIASTGCSFNGTNTNNSATAGQIGEYVTANVGTGSAVPLTTATPANVTNISLTAGDWMVGGGVGFSGTTNQCSNQSCGVSLTSATLPAGVNGLVVLAAGSGIFGGSALAIPQTRISLSATATVYLVASATFATGAANAYGFIEARRVR